MNTANGGFPPIKICLEELKKIMPLKMQKNTDSTKQRLYVPNKKINIKQILKDSIIQPIIKTNVTKEEDMIIVDSF